MGQAARLPLPLMSALTALCLTGGCTTPQAETSTRQDTRANQCVSIGRINSYSVIDDEHLVLNTNVSEQYLVTTRSRCSGMRSGIHLGLSFNSNTRICPPFIEQVTTSDGLRCQIDTIETVESVEAARALVDSRREADSETER